MNSCYPRLRQSWETSDGKLHESQNEASLYQAALNFRMWCKVNICVGGEWTSDMVANAILDHWLVEPK